MILKTGPARAIKTENGYSSTMDSPDQGANGIPITSISYSNSILAIEISNAGIKKRIRRIIIPFK